MLKKIVERGGNVKKWIPILLAACLLLSGCGAVMGGTADSTKPTAPPEPYSPYYEDYAQRSMTATVLSYCSDLGRMADLNNLYKDQAAALYKVLNTASYRRSQLDTPDGVPYLRITFRPHSDQGAEVYTIYENDLVEVGHTTGRQRVHTAAAGTFYQTLTYLQGVRKAQSAYVTLQGADSDGEGCAAGYTIRYQGGRENFIATGTDMPQIDLFGEGLVRVSFRQTVTLYDTINNRKTPLPGLLSDVTERYVAVAEQSQVTIYPLFSTKAAGRVYVAAPNEEMPVLGLSFTEEGKKLHIVSHNAADSVQDTTITVSTLTAGKRRYLLGDWQSAGGYVTEDVAQNIGYKALKRLRGREAEMGCTFSAVPTYVFTIDEDLWYLTEIGRWKDGEYEIVTHLMVARDLTVGYEVTVKENQLMWNTEKDWFK